VRVITPADLNFYAPLFSEIPAVLDMLLAALDQIRCVCCDKQQHVQLQWTFS
jgi:hypothetical protein